MALQGCVFMGWLPLMRGRASSCSVHPCTLLHLICVHLRPKPAKLSPDFHPPLSCNIFLFLLEQSMNLIMKHMTTPPFLVSIFKDITACQRRGYNSRNLSIRDFSCDTQDFLYGRVKAAIFSHWSRAKGKGKREAWP